MVTLLQILFFMTWKFIFVSDLRDHIPDIWTKVQHWEFWVYMRNMLDFLMDPRKIDQYISPMG